MVVPVALCMIPHRDSLPLLESVDTAMGISSLLETVSERCIDRGTFDHCCFRLHRMFWRDIVIDHLRTTCYKHRISSWSRDRLTQIENGSSKALDMGAIYTPGYLSKAPSSLSHLHDLRPLNAQSAQVF